jgi:hypothetical protein
MIVPSVPTWKMSSGVGSFADEQLAHHVREHDDVAERQKGNDALFRTGLPVVALEKHRWTGFYRGSPGTTKPRGKDGERTRLAKSAGAEDPEILHAWAELTHPAAPIFCGFVRF